MAGPAPSPSHRPQPRCRRPGLPQVAPTPVPPPDGPGGHGRLPRRGSRRRTAWDTPSSPGTGRTPTAAWPCAIAICRFCRAGPAAGGARPRRAALHPGTGGRPGSLDGAGTCPTRQGSMPISARNPSCGRRMGAVGGTALPHRAPALSAVPQPGEPIASSRTHTVIVARDGTDAGAPARRQAVREKHIARVGPMAADGTLALGGPSWYEAGVMRGSIAVTRHATDAAARAWMAGGPLCHRRLCGMEIELHGTRFAPLPYRRCPAPDKPECRRNLRAPGPQMRLRGRTPRCDGTDVCREQAHRRQPPIRAEATKRRPGEARQAGDLYPASERLCRCQARGRSAETIASRPEKGWAMPWKEVSMVDQRREFVMLAASGEVAIAELCRRFGISRDTGDRLLSGYTQRGDAALQPRSRRPHTSPPGRARRRWNGRCSPAPNATSPGRAQLAWRLRDPARNVPRPRDPHPNRKPSGWSPNHRQACLQPVHSSGPPRRRRLNPPPARARGTPPAMADAPAPGAG